MIKMEPPHSLRHTLWHTILGVLLIVDGITCLLTLGMWMTEYSLYWIEGKGDWLFKHRVVKHPEELTPEEMEKIVRAKLQELGVQIINIDNPNDIFGENPPGKDETWN